MSASPSRHRVALAVALAGVALSALTVFVHERITADPGYTSFCNLGGAINCDVVLGSRYGRMLGGTLAAVHRPPPATNLAEVRMRDPQFVDWYTGLPVRPLRELTAGEEHVKGPEDAAITIVEFSDFQCPHCAEAFPELRKLLRSRSDVRLVFRHYPLDSSCNTSLPVPLHPNACLAAIAAECAGDQGRFWEYHDVLFENHEL